MTFSGSDNVLVNHFAGEDGKVSPLTSKISLWESIGAGPAYGIGFSSKVERPPRELGKVLKEDGDEGMDVLCSVFGGTYNFAVIGVRETDSDPVRLRSISDTADTEVV